MEMGILTFDLSEVRKQLDIAMTGKPQKLWGEETGRGLWLVGDAGIYLMANAEQPQPIAVAYAEEANPNLDPKGYFEAKREIFGGDDGVEFISSGQANDWLTQLEAKRSKVAKITISPDTFELAV